MTTTPTTPADGDSQAEDSDWVEGRGSGLVGFATILIATFGFFNCIDGIVAIARSHVFVEDAHYVFGDLRTWGWVVLLFGILQLIAAGALVQGRQWARWFSIVVLAVNTLVQMAFLPSYPFWAIVLIAVNIVALYGLTAYGGRPLPGRMTEVRGVSPYRRPMPPA